MNVTIYLQTDYENKSNGELGENKPNSNPIKPNFQKAKMNVNLTLTKDYRKNDDFVVRINKPNSNPISKSPKPIKATKRKKESQKLFLALSCRKGYNIVYGEFLFRLKSDESLFIVLSKRNFPFVRG